MTKISSIYDAIETLVNTQLTGYTKIPDAYRPDDANALYKIKGYTVAFGPATNTERVVGCKLSVERTFSVVLVNQVLTTDNNTTARVNQEKALMEDVFKLIKAAENDADLGGYTAKFAYVDDSGIEYLEDDRAKYYSVVVSFTAHYFESLT